MSDDDGLTYDDIAAFKARCEAAPAHPELLILEPRRFRWWEWPIVQWWWWRQYKRADRRAFRQECAAIRWREAWKDRW